VRAGTIKAYAVMSRQRLQAAPEIPTVDEAGLPGFYASPWFALWAPKGTPRDVIARLNAAMMDALADGAVRQRLRKPEARSCRARSRRPRRSRPCRRPRSPNGGRS
jgi:tripartite-type tricarboxylate transporter receptor subunit TctC